MFVNLHTHSHYSLRDGLSTVDEIVDRAIELKQPAVAITDHGNMNAWVDFWLYTKDRDLLPIYGCEFYCVENHLDFKKGEKRHHLIMLAKNKTGLQAMFSLLYQAIPGFYYSPRIDLGLIERNLASLAGNVIVGTACISGYLQTAILNKNVSKQRDFISKLKDWFGSDFYFEVQFNEMSDQKVVNTEMLRLADKYGVDVFVSGDSHYTLSEDYEAHRDLLYLQTGNKKGKLSAKSKGGLWEFDAKELYFKSEEQMRQSVDRFGYDFPSDWLDRCIAETVNICKKVEPIEVDCGDKSFIPPQYSSMSAEERYEVLLDLCRKGFADKRKYFEPGTKQQYAERVNKEMDLLKSKGFIEYFLTVYDIIDRAKKEGIIVGYGRGSAAGSLVAYLLGITGINPIRFNLIFERFLNPDRNDPPDIDVDFSDNETVKKRLFEWYNDGQNTNVAYVSNYTYFSFRSTLRSLCRVYGVPLKDVGALIDDIEKNFKPEAGERLSVDAGIKCSAKAKEFFDTDIGCEVLRSLVKLTGKINHVGRHASGMVIYDNIFEDMACNAVSKNFNEMQTSATDGANQRGVSDLGHHKYDILCIDTLSIIDETLKLVANGDQEIYLDLRQSMSPDVLNLEDPEVYDTVFKKDKLMGIFQLEGRGIRALIKQIKPDCFEDIVAISALFRPGPLSSGMTDKYAEGKSDPSTVTYIHDSLKPILKDTHGIIVYQEQVMRIAAEVGNLPLGRGDMLRKLTSKKLAQSSGPVYTKWKRDVQSLKKDLLTGFLENGIDEQTGLKIWDLMFAFAGYGFNRSHSVSYSVISFQSAYLKHYHTLEFYCALLNSEKFDNYSLVIKEAKSLGIDVVKPSISKSSSKFSIIDGDIVFGLSKIKGVGEKAACEIERCGPYKTINDFFFSSKIRFNTVNSRVVEVLVKSGCFDDFGYSRDEVLAGFYASKKGRKSTAGGGDLFGDRGSFLDIAKAFVLHESYTEDEKVKIDELKDESHSAQVRDQQYFFGHIFDHVFKKILGVPVVKEAIDMYDVDTHTVLRADVELTLIFMVKEIAFRSDKNGEMMAFLDILTLDLRALRLVVFATSYNLLVGKNGFWMKQGSFYCCKVTVNYYNSEYSLVFNYFYGEITVAEYNARKKCLENWDKKYGTNFSKED
jgi:DNA polymerase-3 subunit alpha